MDPAPATVSNVSTQVAGAVDNDLQSDRDIDESLRRKFERAWVQGQPLPVEDCLPRRDAPRFLATLEELIHIEMEFAWKRWQLRPKSMRSDDSSDRPKAIEYYVQNFAELDQPAIIGRLVIQECGVRKSAGDGPSRDEYLKRFSRVAGVERAIDSVLGVDASTVSRKPETPTLTSTAAGGARSHKPSNQFAGYELLDEIGRGGMGVVYRARQLSAGRIVALKLIRNDRLESVGASVRQRVMDRFRHEAQAAARLEHEHIVTVHEVGEFRGDPFFSMRYVDGPTLFQVLSERPLDNREAARYIRQIALAVEQAHRHGILHRDIKPQNILIDEQIGHALIADFGVAKLSLDEGAITRVGEIIGTPPFMSPEQARDSAAVSKATDVYALGATLYNLLCGRPPFQAAEPVETIRQVIHDDPVPPSRLNSAIDRDLETICLKCLRKEPGGRYDSAAALAGDLENYLDGKAILARPAGRAERAVRWCRRNPVAGTSLGLAALFLLIALVASTAGYMTTKVALEVKTTALEQSQQSYRHARDTVNQFFTVVSEDTLLNQPGMQPLREDLLRLALGQYQRFLQDHRDDPRLTQEIARTHYRIGLISELVDESLERPLESLQRAESLQQRLLTQRPSTRLRAEYGDTLNAIGRMQTKRAEHQEAMSTFDRARKLRESLTVGDPDDLRKLRLLANTIMNIGLVQKRMRDHDAAAISFDRAQELRAKVCEERADEIDGERLLIDRDFAIGLYNRAHLNAVVDRRDEAESDLLHAIERFGSLRQLQPEALEHVARLASCYDLLGSLRFRARDYEDAANSFRSATDLIEGLANQSPRVTEYQEQLASVLINSGAVSLRTGQPRLALPCFERARVILGKIVPPPDSGILAARRRNYAVALRELARVELELQRFESAGEHLQLSHQYFRDLAEQFPDNQNYVQDLRVTESMIQAIKAESISQLR